MTKEIDGSQEVTVNCCSQYENDSCCCEAKEGTRKEKINSLPRGHSVTLLFTVYEYCARLIHFYSLPNSLTPTYALLLHFYDAAATSRFPEL